MKVWAETEDNKDDVVHRFGHQRKTLELIDPHFLSYIFLFRFCQQEYQGQKNVVWREKVERLILSVDERHWIVGHRLLFPV